MAPNEKKPVQGQGTELALIKKNLTDSVMARLQPLIESKELRLPANYSAGNALQSAWFELLEVKSRDKKPALEVCTHSSVANALYKMVTMGLSAAKKQCAFIVYGEKLVCQPEYHGNIALAKRYGGVAQVNAGVIYEKDIFKYQVNNETGRKKIIEHSQELENIDNKKIRGAYAVLTFTDGSEPYLEVMTIDQITKSWEQGQMNGKGPVHENFREEMSKKTVINRACKLFITSSDDAALFTDDESTDMPRIARDESLQDKGNKKDLNITDATFEDVGPTTTHEHMASDEPAKGELFEAAPEPPYGK